MSNPPERTLALIYEKLASLDKNGLANLDPSLAPSTRIGDLDLDSLDMLQLAMELEEALSIEIEVVDFSGDMTIAGLAKHLDTLRQ